MNPFEAGILGFIQGATEFLPVSSSGHLVIGQTVLGIGIEGVQFEVAVHVATLLSVVIVYRGRLATLVSGAVGFDRDAWRYIGLLAVGSIPAAVLGLGARSMIESVFEAPWVTGVALLFTAAFLWSSKLPLSRDLSASPGLREASLIGLAQALALVPGISRSGSTVVTALWLGVEAREAAAFSFLLALPAIGGAAVLQIPDVMETGGAAVGGTALTIAVAVSAVTGVLAIKTFVALLARRGFHAFGHYCAVVGIGFLVFLGLRP